MGRRGFTGVMMKSFGVKDHDITVVGIEQLAPHFRRIRFRSETLFSDAQPGPTAWVRIWFPDNDPDNEGAEHQRAYTFTEADDETGEFACDFVLHEPAGPASAWASTAAPGMTLQAQSNGSSVFEPDEDAAGYLLFGDAASLPGLNGVIGTIPETMPIELYFEEHGEQDRQLHIADHPRMTIHRIARNGEESLAEAVETREWANWKVWASTESATLKLLRQRLRDDFGFPKSEIYARAYWYEGRAFGSRRSKEEAQREKALAEEAKTKWRKATEDAEVQEKWRARAAGRLLAPLKPTFWIAGIVQALVTLLQISPFILLTELARLMLIGASTDRLWLVGIWAVILMGLGLFTSTVLMLWLHSVDARFEKDLRQRLLNKVARLPLGWFDKRTSGQVKTLIQDDTLSMHYLITHAVPDAVAAVIAPVTVLVYLFIVDWRLGLVMLIPILIYLLTMYRMIVQSGSKMSKAQAWAERMNSEAGSFLEGQSVIRVFGASSRFRAQLGRYIDFLGEWQRPFIGQKTVMDLATRPSTFLLLIALFGTIRITGGMDPVDILPFLFLGTTFGAQLLGLGYGLAGLRGGISAARNIQNTLDEDELHTRLQTSTSTTPNLHFDNVTFSYVDGVPVLRDVNLELKPGTVTALVGPSGSGKSTLASLLARFHDVDEGAILIDGKDIREMEFDELYRHVGFVFQDTQLVHGTVRENIALAVPGADDSAVTTAAKAAQIHDRIMQMPEGYDTVIGSSAGSSGTALSGGEKQRLTIARAILADTPVLVLDEATAFADPESEYLVQRALNELVAGRTVLVIAHRLHTITGVDTIVVLDEGRIVESGTHNELIAGTRAGRYRRLWDAAEAKGAIR